MMTSIWYIPLINWFTWTFFTDGGFASDLKNHENVNFYEVVRNKYYLQRLVNLLK